MARSLGGGIRLRAIIAGRDKRVQMQWGISCRNFNAEGGVLAADLRRAFLGSRRILRQQFLILWIAVGLLQVGYLCNCGKKNWRAATKIA